MICTDHSAADNPSPSHMYDEASCLLSGSLGAATLLNIALAFIKHQSQGLIGVSLGLVNFS